jgi:hypothetical protein
MMDILVMCIPQCITLDFWQVCCSTPQHCTAVPAIRRGMLQMQYARAMLKWSHAPPLNIRTVCVGISCQWRSRWLLPQVLLHARTQSQKPYSCKGLTQAPSVSRGVWAHTTAFKEFASPTLQPSKHLNPVESKM